MKSFLCFGKRLLVLGVIVMMSSCATYVLKPAGSSKVKNLSFNTSVNWNQIPSGFGPNTEVWTVDGALLNRLIFITGVESGKGIFNDMNKDTPMPKFNPKVLPHELKALIETSLTNTSGGKYPVKTTNLKPLKINGKQGAGFDLEFYNADGLLNRGKVVAVIDADKLNAVIFTAAAVYHYDKYTPEFENIVKTIQF
ncbi:hypothetical protein GCM10011613_23300 [Cellvibrio zantedeschiae]|uniref:PsbP C-terminal domain-containing protein n=1 Tax=Cellvibrio zantedeschiae TaxID=1237077 RepID=A0ABQ3B4I9_9GAMM|nr:hypothetical protein [Cellvibrio zantedeschiae]GGY78053.1 hypothetical protein GCM10011613_23300 [Cellvibrio zantedeschiae]